MLSLVTWSLVASVLGGLATRGMLRYATTRRILDYPNERSSHARATPRGGGMGVVATVEAMLLAFGVAGAVPWPLVAAVGGGGALVAAAGWVDDRRGLSAGTRALIHFVAATWSVVWLRGLPELTLGAHAWQGGAIGGVLAVVGIVWATNLFNFMDGIDGIAAGEAVITAFAAAFLLHRSAPAVALVFAVVAGASAGFLRWNWMPARIFMGDVGSGFLGFALGVLAVAAQNARVLDLPLSLVLYGVFVFDATVTLLRRALAGEQWYGAHRSHAYQRAVLAGASHAAVTSAVLVIDLALIACVLWARRSPQHAVAALLIALLLLVAVYLLVERASPMRRSPSTANAPMPEDDTTTSQITRW